MNPVSDSVTRDCACKSQNGILHQQTQVTFVNIKAKLEILFPTPWQFMPPPYASVVTIVTCQSPLGALVLNCL